MPNMVLLRLLHCHMIIMTLSHMHASLATAIQYWGECEGSVARWNHCISMYVAILLVWTSGPSPSSRVWAMDYDSSVSCACWGTRHIMRCWETAVWVMGSHPTEIAFNVAIHGLDYVFITMHFIILLPVKPIWSQFLQNTEFNSSTASVGEGASISTMCSLGSFHSN